MARLKAWIDVEDTTPAVTGPGPITNVEYFSMKRRMNRAGAFHLIVPATDPRVVELLANERTIQCYAMINGTKTWLGGGVIQQQTVQIVDRDSPRLVVRGIGLLGELARDTVGDLTLTDTGANNITAVLTTAPAGWTVTQTGTATAFQHRFIHETTLNALVILAEKLDAVFRLEASGSTIRRLNWYNTLPSTSQAHLFYGVDPHSLDDNTLAAAITQIQEIEDSAELVNKIYVDGAGNGDDQLSLAQVDTSTHVWPDDSTTLGSSYNGPYGHTYDYDGTDDAIEVTDSISSYGTRARAITLKDTGMLANTDASFDANLNTLIKAAVNWVGSRASTVKTYRLTVVGLKQTVLPGDIVTVDARVYRDGVAPINIEAQDLTVLETETVLNASGVHLTSMICSERRRWPMNAGEHAISEARKVVAYQKMPQTFKSIDTYGEFREPLDDDETAQFNFWLAEETTWVDQVILRYKVDNFWSMAAGATGGAVANVAYTHTASTGITTTGTGSSHTHTLTMNAHSHSVSGDEHTHQVTVASGTITNNVGFDSSNNLVNADVSAHTFDTDSNDTGGSADGTTSTGTVGNESSHTHSITDPSHYHTMLWGMVRESGSNTYTATDIEFRINGGSWGSSVSAISGATGWYELDLTSDVRDSTTKRPNESDGHYVLEARIKTASKSSDTCQIRAQIQARTAVQALASF